MGAIAEAFGVAYAAAGAMGKAKEWLTRALSAPDGSASLRTATRLDELDKRRGRKASAAGPGPA